MAIDRRLACLHTLICCIAVFGEMHKNGQKFFFINYYFNVIKSYILHTTIMGISEKCQKTPSPQKYKRLFRNKLVDINFRTNLICSSIINDAFRAFYLGIVLFSVL